MKQYIPLMVNNYSSHKKFILKGLKYDHDLHKNLFYNTLSTSNPTSYSQM